MREGCCSSREAKARAWPARHRSRRAAIWAVARADACASGTSFARLRVLRRHGPARAVVGPSGLQHPGRGVLPRRGRDVPDRNATARGRGLRADRASITGLTHRTLPSPSNGSRPTRTTRRRSRSSPSDRSTTRPRCVWCKVPSRPTHDARFTGTAGRSRSTGLPSSSPASAAGPRTSLAGLLLVAQSSTVAPQTRSSRNTASAAVHDQGAAASVRAIRNSKSKAGNITIAYLCRSPLVMNCRARCVTAAPGLRGNSAALRDKEQPGQTGPRP